jgi:hypothetical protein
LVVVVVNLWEQAAGFRAEKVSKDQDFHPFSSPGLGGLPTLDKGLPRDL